jgi:hypothetical protein
MMKAAGGCVCVAMLASLLSCGGNAQLFNPAFVNTISGGQFPLTPGPEADFVLVRVVNATTQIVEFVVTVERQVPVTDDDGNPQLDVDGVPITQPERKTVRLTTFPVGRSSELGVTFPCNITPITRVGLGEMLSESDAAIFVGGEGPLGNPGFGVPAGDLNPLISVPDQPSNFRCGDTVIFRAITATGVTGGVKLESFVLSDDDQPSVFTGPNTFVNLQTYLGTIAGESEEGP